MARNMKRTDRELLHRSLDGPLSISESEHLKKLVSLDAEARSELEALRGLRERLRPAVETAAQASVRPFFVDRVMRRLQSLSTAVRPSPEEMLARSLSWSFWRLGLAASLLVLGLAFYNSRLPQSYDTQRGAIEVVLALPPVSLDTAHEYDFPRRP
jgi:anti-sigma factor RsiW